MVGIKAGLAETPQPASKLVRRSRAAHTQIMPDEPRKIFDLMDTETEPTDEQLEELMRYVGESIRAKKRAAGLPGAGAR